MSALAPDGRVEVEGVVLHLHYEKFEDLGGTWKMEVQLPDSCTVECSVPRGANTSVGAFIRFVATFERVRNNPSHAWGKRPVLLTALEACQVQLAEYVAYFQKRGGCSVEIESAEEQARAAIAKAKQA